MQQRPSRATRLLRSLAILAPAGAFLAAGSLVDPGQQLERHLQTAALAESLVLAGTPQPVTSVASRAIEENSEAFWLTRAPESESVSRVTWTAPVAAGDRIVVNFGAWTRHMLDVVSVEDADANATRIDTGAAGEPRFVLTCRKVSDPDAPLVRLTVDADGRGITSIGTSVRSL